MLFFEKKAKPAVQEPKNVYFPAAPKIEAMAGILPPAQE